MPMFNLFQLQDQSNVAFKSRAQLAEKGLKEDANTKRRFYTQVETLAAVFFKNMWMLEMCLKQNNCSRFSFTATGAWRPVLAKSTVSNCIKNAHSYLKCRGKNVKSLWTSLECWVFSSRWKEEGGF